MQTSRKALALVLVLSVGGVLTGCITIQQPSTQSSSIPIATPPQPDEQASAEQGNDDVITAIGTAQSAVDRSTAWSIDWYEQEGAWEISVIADGQEHEVRVSANGSTVLSTYADEVLEPEDAQEINRASISITDAIRTAQSGVNGTLVEASLEEENGAVYWSLDFRDDANMQSITVAIDATTGAALTISD